jgi:LysM repeat protein
MAYDFYLGKVLLPVAPSKLQLKIGNANKTYTLINEGEINVLKSPELTDIDFEILLPNVDHGFGRYKDGFKPAEYYLERLKEMKQNKETFQFIVTRQLPNGKSLYGTNMKVSLEDYHINENADNGFDTTVSIKLKQYRDYGTKTCNITFAGTKPKASVNKPRATSNNAPSGGTYTVRSGDSLWKIAASQLGNGSRWGEIYNLNKSVIGGNPNLIYPNQVFTLPAQ